MDDYFQRKISENSFSSIKDEIINESELPTTLAALEAQALLHIEERNYTAALANLKRSEEIMEAVATQGGRTDPDQVLAVIHNIALCYQQLDDWKKCVLYLDACIYNASTFDIMKGKISHSEDQIRKIKYICKLYLQYCGALSRLDNHQEALIQAKNAYKLSCEALILTIQAVKRQQSCLKNKKKKDEKYEQKCLLINRSLPSLNAIEMFISKGHLPNGAEIRSALGVRGHPEWVYHFKMSEIMVLNPAKTEDFKSGVGIQAEYTKDYILYKVSLLAISLYCIGMELQFNSRKKTRDHNFEMAIRLMRAFFPEECPLIQHFLENSSQSEESKMQEISVCKPKIKPNRRSSSDFIGQHRVHSYRDFRSSIQDSSSKKSIKRPKSALRSISPERPILGRYISLKNKSFEQFCKPKRNSNIDPIKNSRVHVD